MSLQQAQTAATHSGLQEALHRLQRLREQLKNSTSVVENTNNTVRETNLLMTHTHTSGLSTTLNFQTIIKKLHEG